MKMLSIGMIVKNEEAVLEETLKALQPLRDVVETELIIADTGSTDSTPEIAKRYADKFFTITWENDFAKARNATLANATGKWFFYLDADEVLTDATELIQFFQSNKSRRYKSVGIRIRNILSSKENHWNEFWVNRLFCRNGKQQFTGAIHEIVMVDLPSFPLRETFLLHKGYDNDDVERMKKKSQRNVALAEEKIESASNIVKKCKAVLDLMDSLALGGERVDEAVDQAWRAVEMIKEFPERGTATRKFYLARAYSYILRRLANKGEYQSCLEYGKQYLQEQKEIGVKDSDIFYILGNVHFILNNYEKAIEYFETYLQLMQQDKLELSFYFVLAYDSFEEKARFNIVQSYIQLRESEKAWELLKTMPERYVGDVDLLQYKFNVASKEHMEERLPEFYQTLEENDVKALFVSSLREAGTHANAEQMQQLIATLRNMGPDKVFRQQLLCYTDDVIEFCELLQELPDEPLVDTLGTILYQVCRFGQSWDDLGEKLDLHLLSDYAAICANCRKDFAEQLLAYCKEVLPETMSLRELHITRYLYNYLLFYAETQEALLIPLWEEMLHCAALYQTAVYKDNVCQEENLYLFSPLERFVYYSQQAQAARQKQDYVVCLQLLRKGLEEFPQAKSLVEQIKEEAAQQLAPAPEIQDELTMLAEQVKVQIRGFIAQQELDNAAMVLEQLKTLVPNDPELVVLEMEMQTTDVLLN